MLLFIPAPHHSHSFLASSLNAFLLLFFLMQTDCSCLTCLFFFPTRHVSVCELAVISILSFVCQIFFQTSIAQLVPALCLFKFAFVPLLLRPRLYAVLHCFGRHSHLALDRLIPFWICSSRPWLICSFPG